MGWHLAGHVARGQIVLDGRSPPHVEPGLPGLAPYVDNFQALCRDAEDAELWCFLVTKLLDEVGLAYRVECRSLPGFTLVGLDVDMRKLFVRNAPKRWWRV